MSKSEYLIIPKGTKFTGSGKLGLIKTVNQIPINCWNEIYYVWCDWKKGNMIYENWKSSVSQRIHLWYQIDPKMLNFWENGKKSPVWEKKKSILLKFDVKYWFSGSFPCQKMNYKNVNNSKLTPTLRGYCTPDQFFDCLCIFFKNYNTLVASKTCFL